jgi:hypothetical protein
VKTPRYFLDPHNHQSSSTTAEDICIKGGAGKNFPSEEDSGVFSGGGGGIGIEEEPPFRLELCNNQE